MQSATKANAGKYLGIPGYASGGDFGGGLRLVGENGPELEVTGPSRIFNANQTTGMLRGGSDNAALLSELKQMREENKSQRFQIAKTNQQVAALLQKWDAEGTHQEMEASMGDLDEKIAAGEPLMQQALQALRRYNEAQGVKPAEEVERLRLEAEALMTAVTEYVSRSLGGPVRSLH